MLQGDAYNQRFGNTVTVRRMILRATVAIGATATSSTSCRVCVVRAQFNLGASRIDNITISPTANTNIMQVYYDKVFTVGAPVGSVGFPVDLNVSLPLKNTRVKFNGAGAGAVSAESIFLIWSANVATGGTAPVWGSGIIETWFTP